MGHWQEPFKCTLVEQRIAARKEKAVEVTFLRQADEGLPMIGADANRRDRPIRAEAIQGPVCTGHYHFAVIVGIVDEHDVDPV